MIRRIAVIYAVGVAGFTIPFAHGIFMLLTPLVLLLSLGLLIWHTPAHRPQLGADDLPHLRHFRPVAAKPAQRHPLALAADGGV